jgi:flavin-dependent dehydrogenase
VQQRNSYQNKTINMTYKARIIVIGAGPAGLMAAGQAAQRGADVTLIERMERPGRNCVLPDAT